MKKTLFSFIILAFTANISIGQLIPDNSTINFTPKNRTLSSNQFSQNRTATCTDTNDYTLNKSTGLKMLSINNATSASSAGQYYDCPQPITISGMEFYAYSTSLPNVVCSVELYLAGTDSLPTGSPLALVSVNIDSTFGGGAIGVIEKTAVFATPITVSAPYVIVFTNNSSNNISLVCNDYNAIPADGIGENLTSLKIGATWLHGNDVSVGGSPFDADWIFSPFTQTNLTANFAYDVYCIPDTVNFTNLSSPVIGNRMYNIAKALGVEEVSYSWDFGDASTVVNAINTGHRYTTSGPFSISLTDTLYGWRNSYCITDTTKVIDGRYAKPRFKDSVVGLSVHFTDTTNLYLDTPTFWLWDFGDGNTSTMQNPVHTYASSGTYTICLTTSGNCGADSSCKTISTNTVGIDYLNENKIKIYPNPANDVITITGNHNQLIVTDFTGRKVKELQLNQKNSILINELNNGYYFITNSKGEVLGKFLKN